MRILKKIALFISGTMLSVLLLFPVAIQFTHIFLHHNHTECFDYASIHIHQKNIDCDILKIKLNSFALLPTPVFEQVIPDEFVFLLPEYHFFTEQERHYSNSLRGPPSLS